MSFKYCIPEKHGPYSSMIRVLCGNVEIAFNCSCLDHEEIMDLLFKDRYERFCKVCLDKLEREVISARSRSL